MVSRRTFGTVSLAALVGSASPVQASEVISNQRAESMIQYLQEMNRADSIFLRRTHLEYDDAIDAKARHIEKYGCLDKPELTLDQTLEFSPIDYGATGIEQVTKDANYAETLVALYEAIQLLIVDLNYLRENVFNNPNMPDLLPNLQALLEEPVAKPYYLGEGAPLDFHSLDLIDLLVDYIAGTDVELLYQPSITFDIEELYFVQDEFRKLSPHFVREVSDEDAIHGIIDDLLEGVVTGYKGNLPNIVVHPKDEFNEAAKQDTGSARAAAYFHFVTDSLNFSQKGFFYHMFELAHEPGHLLARPGLSRYFEIWDAAKKDLDFMDNLVTGRSELVGKIGEYQSVTDPTLRQALSTQIQSSYDAMKRLEGEAVDIRERFEERASNQPNLDYKPVDEAAAYLFQDIVLNNYAKKDLEAAKLLLRLRDANYRDHSQEHYSGYQLARKLKRKHNGNSLDAFNEIVAMTDPSDINRLSKEAAKYGNRLYQAVSSRDELLTNSSIALTKIRVEDRIKELELAGKTDAQALIVISRVEVGEKRVADLFRKYVGLTAPYLLKAA
jgi:hypothetical protein